MKPFLNCRIHSFKSLHLNQIYEGFQMLSKRGLINIEIDRSGGDVHKPVLTVIINDKYKVIYDTLDGLNWISASLKDNLNYFNKEVNADFYFKRSYTPILENYKKKELKIFPLGFNYSFEPSSARFFGKKERLKSFIRKLPLSKQYFKYKNFHYSQFSYPPIVTKKNKILFLARLWNPEGVKSEHLKEERFELNRERIQIIRNCKEVLGDLFLGGLQRDDFASKIAPDLLMPSSFTNKESYLKSVKEHSICVATTGLHNSIGWKFGEYVAASRAIITEPLKYRVPGNFEEKINYFSFTNSDELIQHATGLIENPDALQAMMTSNYNYYNNYLAPDKLVLNSLLKVYENI